MLRKIGIDFEAVGGPQFCCGIVHHGQGDVGAATRLSSATVSKLDSYRAKTLIMWCPSCDMHFDEVVAPTVAQDFAGTITHATPFLADRADDLPFTKRVPSRVAVHTHDARPQQERDARAALTLLQAVPGVEVVGTVSSPLLGYHCPTPPTPEARRVFEQERGRLLGEGRALGADTVVTLYHSCHREWSQMHRDDLAIRNYICLVAEALEYGSDDRYRRLRPARRVDELVAASEPQWSRQGWDRQRATKVARAYFPEVPDEYRTDNG